MSGVQTLDLQPAAGSPGPGRHIPGGDAPPCADHCGLSYEYSDPKLFMSPNEVDDIMKGIYPKSYGTFAGVQVVIFRVKAAGKSLMWIEYALNDCPFLEAFRNPFPGG